MGLVASPRRGGNCEFLTRVVLSRAAAQGIKADLVRLSDLRLGFCRGCLTCIYGAGCPQKDDAGWLFATAGAYDGLVVAAPVYLTGVPALFKTLIDRGVSRFPHFKNENQRVRPAVSVLVTARTSEGPQDLQPPEAWSWPDRIAGAVLAEAVFLLGGSLVGSLTVSAAGPGDASEDPAVLERARRLGLDLAHEIMRPAASPGPTRRAADQTSGSLCPVCGLPRRGADRCPFCLESVRPQPGRRGRYHPVELARHLDEWMLPSRDRFLRHLDDVRGAVRDLGEPAWRRLRPPRPEPDREGGEDPSAF